MEIFLQKLIILLKELKVIMFNFDELKIIKGKESQERKCGSFVGIRKDRNTKEMHFILPRGFEDFDPNYNNVKYLDSTSKCNAPEARFYLKRRSKP